MFVNTEHIWTQMHMRELQGKPEQVREACERAGDGEKEEEREREIS